MIEFIRDNGEFHGDVTVRVQLNGEILAGFVGDEAKAQLAEDFFNLGYRSGTAAHPVRFLPREDP